MGRVRSHSCAVENKSRPGHVEDDEESESWIDEIKERMEKHAGTLLHTPI